ncbi:TerC family protein [Chryseolinea sp. H1M3-3]|uniref:TerC family protein n=1 Tax=Chryseolinea sp. H1M3-3 TaxID=3034144 RepID=UPI0023EBA7C5|nr:TerC family protein [Chryseolinea sp. H1M3-3]
MSQTSLWIGFNVFVLLMLVLDLGVFHRKSKAITVKEALIWTCVWVFMAFLFNVFVYYQLGEAKAFEFFTGYLIEKSLSVDNIFVIIMIFSYFNVPPAYQHKVLFWGILGALVMRVCFILAGVELIHKFHWLIYIFGAFLVFTGIRILTQDDSKFNPEKNPVVKFVRRLFRVTPGFEEDKFFVKRDNLLWATPLFVVVVMIEATDLIFAVDSIPAILAVSDDSFIVYTSNVFAILGLRSLYFALAGIEKYFVYLKYGLSAILIFVGVKMCVSDFYKIPVEISLAFIILTLSLAILASMAMQQRKDIEK